MKTLTPYLLLTLLLITSPVFSQTGRVIRYATVAGENAPTAYMNSGMEIFITVSPEPKPYNLSISGNPEEVLVKMLEPRKFRLVPLKGKFSFKLFNAGVLLAEERYDARPEPSLRKIQATVDGKPYDAARGIPRGASMLNIIPEVAEELKDSCPKDSHFKIVSMKMEITGRQTLTVNSGAIDLKKYAVKAGDVITLHDLTVTRGNWNDETVVVKSTVTATFNVK